MARRKTSFSRFVSVSMIILMAIFFIGFGFLLGYRFIIYQSQRQQQYDQSVLEQLEASRKAKEANPSETDPNAQRQTPTTKPIIELVNQKTPGAVMVYIEVGDRPADIGRKLEELGVIRSSSLFTILSKVNGYDGTYRSGTHFVKKNMPYDAIMYLLSRDPVTVDITFPEGVTYLDIKDLLHQNGMQVDDAKLDAALNDPELLEEYPFLRDIPAEERPYRLEGYLFPDTYFYDLNTDEKTIVRRFLDNTKNKLLPEYYERAESLGMTMDQVIILASIIEKESGSLTDRYKVSRVFHNRLKKQDLFQSCATINYLRRQDGLEPVFIVRENDLNRESPFNTYKHAGLPPGPICSPGIESIKAALYPDVKDRNVYYFVATGKGENHFSHSFAEHEAAIEKYLVPLEESAEKKEETDTEHTGA